MNPPPDHRPELPDGRILRLLDANANRAREALRVVEDYARFVLDDAGVSAELKGLRHGLAEATRAFVADAVLHRDTPGDVGTGIKTPTELTRAGVSDVVTAAGKRLGEALRAIEEFLKAVSPADAAKVEALRYRFYDVEHRVAFTLRPPAAAGFANVRLYVLITESLCRQPWLDAAEQAILGGADCLQLREKDLEGAELLRRARQLVALCRRHNVPCVINDRADVAILCGADGVHVGQGDLPAREARKLLGQGKIIGVSTHNVEQAKQAVLDGADYIGVGPVFRSSTKPRDFVAGLEYARQVAEGLPQIPAVAIAGIHAGNVDEVLSTGLRAVAVTSAVLSAPDVRTAAAELKRKLLAGSGRAAVPVAQTTPSAKGSSSTGGTMTGGM
jgi:thiamine-phosphate pyrophosphorylase